MQVTNAKSQCCRLLDLAASGEEEGQMEDEPTAEFIEDNYMDVIELPE